jgi:hypothetical protein
VKLTIALYIGAEGVRRAQQRVRGAPEGRAARRLHPGEGGEARPEDWLPLRGMVGKNPAFFLKPSPVVFFGFIWVFCFFLVFYFYFFAQKREFLGFFQFPEYF